MTTVFEANIVLIVIALLVGLVIGWWIFKRSRRAGADHVETHATTPLVEAQHTVPPPVEHRGSFRADTPEGNSIADQGAAAASDVAGEMLGVQVHSELPGAEGPPDNLAIMKGVGPKFVTRLNENGIIRFDQLARLSVNEASILDDKLGPFKGRLARDRVIEQASYLARDDRDGFEAKFGKLGGV